MARYRSKGLFKYLGLIVAIILALILEIDASKYSNSQEMTLTLPVVVDGDTLKTTEHRVRLWGIDAPELAQKCYQEEKEILCGKLAKSNLRNIISEGSIKCSVIDVDRFKRIVARCYNSHGDIGEQMVCSGWALDYESYSKGYYKQCQDKAKKAHNGIWSSTFTKPWDWRKGARNYQ